MLTVHLRINDATTRQPTPVRLRITGPANEAYLPLGRSTDFPITIGEEVGGHVLTEGERWFYIDGSCEIQLPSGIPLTVEVTKGCEFIPIKREIELGTGQMALRMEMTRRISWQERGWWAGDFRTHYLSPHSALLEAAGEGLRVANLLIQPRHMLASDGNTYLSQANITAFSGQKPALESSEAMVLVNTTNKHSTHGTISLVNSHRMIHPLISEEGETDWLVSDWCDQCHRKKGLTVWVDALKADSPLNGGEALAALILGKIDALEFSTALQQRPLLPFWYRLLDAGFATPLVGSSGKDSNRTVMGSTRTYAQVDTSSPFSWIAWLDAVRAGTSFITNGPLLELSVDGRKSGETIESVDGKSLELQSRAESLLPFDRLELLFNGVVIGSSEAKEQDGIWSTSINKHQVIEESGWLAARCLGSASRGSRTFTHTNPVKIILPGRPNPNQRRAISQLQPLLLQACEWAAADRAGRNRKVSEQRHELSLNAIKRLAELCK